MALDIRFLSILGILMRYIIKLSCLRWDTVYNIHAIPKSDSLVRWESLWSQTDCVYFKLKSVRRLLCQIKYIYRNYDYLIKIENG